jgi:tetratricopeptide (TPR) repeat protein
VHYSAGKVGPQERFDVANRSPETEALTAKANYSNSLVATLLEEQRYKEAIEPAIQSLQLSRQIFGECHDSVAISLFNLAGIYKQLGNFEDAEPILIDALTISLTSD